MVFKSFHLSHSLITVVKMVWKRFENIEEIRAYIKLRTLLSDSEIIFLPNYVFDYESDKISYETVRRWSTCNNQLQINVDVNLHCISPFQRSLNPFLVLLLSEMNDTRNRTPSAAILYVRLRHTSVKLAQHGSILSIYVKMHVSLITNPSPTKVNRKLLS